MTQLSFLTLFQFTSIILICFDVNRALESSKGQQTVVVKVTEAYLVSYVHVDFLGYSVIKLESGLRPWCFSVLHRGIAP